MRFAWTWCGLVLLTACAGDTVGGQGRHHSDSSGGGTAGDTADGGIGSSGSTARDGGESMTIPVGDGTGTLCPKLGQTRGCCSGGTQTCGGSEEFPLWGPCLNASGEIVPCTTPSGCGEGEFGPNCDAGPPTHLPCGDGEFGPDCADSGTPLPPQPSLCTDFTVNNEPQILAAFEPANGQAVVGNGQIKVWITDECPAFVAPNEQVDPATGKITVPGDRTSKAMDGYLNEPALYIAPDTAENGGTPHFPQWVKGPYDNMPTSGPFGMSNPFYCVPFPFPGAPPVPMGPPIDPAPPGTMLTETFNTEFIWDVAALGLAPGTYIAEFVIHDGDDDRAVGCVTIVVTAPS